MTVVSWYLSKGLSNQGNWEHTFLYLYERVKELETNTFERPGPNQSLIDVAQVRMVIGLAI